MRSLDKLIWQFRGHRLIRDLAFQLLPHPFVVTNAVYRHFYTNRIRNKAKEFIEYPHAISIESTNLCNANCWLCPHAKSKRAQGIISDDLFSEIIDQVKGFPQLCMFLSGFGEPLMDPKLEDKARLAKQAGIHRVSFYTNGQLLTKDRASHLLEAGIDAVDFSIDAGTAETFNQLRKGLDFDMILENVRNLAGMRKSGKPFITIDMLVAGNNGKEKDRLASLLTGCYDRLVVRQPDDWIGSIRVPRAAKTPHRRIPAQYHPPCKHLWDMMVIYWDGTVPLCCHDYDARLQIGNVRDKPIGELWKSDVLTRYREAHLAHEGFGLHLCCDCQFFTLWW